MLLAALSAGLAAVCGPVRGQEAPDLGSLGAVLDTLLPGDALSPAPTALGLDAEVRDIVMGNPLFTRLFGAALGWMDGLADVPFRDLPEAARIEILALMEASDYDQIPGRFFHVARALACELYFARAEAIRGYPLNAAPQPQGYPPPWT